MHARSGTATRQHAPHWKLFLLYQGFHALFYHRQAHWLYKHKHFFLARALSQLRGI